METTQGQLVRGGSFVGHQANRGLPGWLGRRRGLVIVGAAASAAVAFALSQHWLAAADLLPLLFALPCAVMMFMCMNDTGNGQQSSAASTAARDEPPTVINTLS